MKRWIPLVCLLTVLAAALCLCGSAVDPKDFTGEWYYAGDGSVYTFRDGIVECGRHSISSGDGSAFSGAYSFAGRKIAVFFVGPDGVEEVRELYLSRNRKGDTLCERADGLEKAIFYRSLDEAVRNGKAE